MATSKLVFFFSQAKQGWSETWYRDGVTPAVALAGAVAAGGYLQTRLALLGQSAQCDFVRASNIDPPRDAEFLALGGSGGSTFGNFGDDEQFFGTEEASNGANIRVFATSSHWRSFIMRGMPSNALDIDGKLRPSGRWRDRLPAWVSSLRAVYGVRTISNGASQTITAVLTSNNFLRQITVGALPLGTVVGSLLRVSGITGCTPQINSTYIVTAINGLNIRLRIHNNNIFGTPDVTFATVALVTIAYPSVTGAQAIVMTNRKVGRPGYQPVGRRKARQR